jgi:hypothetical protein
MIFPIPIVGKILAGVAASQTCAGSATQETGAQTNLSLGGAASPADFAQAVADLDRTAGAKAAQRGVFIVAKI